MNNPNPSSHPNDSASSAAEEDSSSSSAAAATTSTPLEASKGPPPPPTEKAETIAPAAPAEDEDEEEDEGHPPMALVVPEKEVVGSTADDPMDVDNVNPATVFCIRLKQPKSNLLHKMSVPELCRNFRCSNVSPLLYLVGV